MDFVWKFAFKLHRNLERKKKENGKLFHQMHPPPRFEIDEFLRTYVRLMLFEYFFVLSWVTFFCIVCGISLSWDRCIVRLQSAAVDDQFYCLCAILKLDCDPFIAHNFTLFTMDGRPLVFVFIYCFYCSRRTKMIAWKGWKAISAQGRYWIFMWTLCVHLFILFFFSFIKINDLYNGFHIFGKLSVDETKDEYDEMIVR